MEIIDFKDLKVLNERVAAIMAKRGVEPGEQVLLAVEFMHRFTSSVIQQSFQDEEKYRVAFHNFVAHAKKSGRAPIEANALVFAWAMRLLQDSQMDVRRA